jgi:hypothetical protein
MWPNEHFRAILDLKTQRDKLKQYQKRITVVTTRETEIARECLRNNDKTRALLALRRKKYQESLLTKTDQQLAQLEGLVSDVEFALIQKDVLYGLQQGTNVLREIQKEMGGLERVELLVREGEEAKAYQEVRSGDRLCKCIGLWVMCADLVHCRRLVNCLEVKCRVKMKMRWRMSLRLWRGRFLA